MSDKATEARRANLEKMRQANVAKAKLKSESVAGRDLTAKPKRSMEFRVPEVVEKTPGANLDGFFAILEVRVQEWLDRGAPGDLILTLTIR